MCPMVSPSARHGQEPLSSPPNTTPERVSSVKGVYATASFRLYICCNEAKACQQRKRNDTAGMLTTNQLTVPPVINSSRVLRERAALLQAGIEAVDTIEQLCDGDMGQPSCCSRAKLQPLAEQGKTQWYFCDAGRQLNKILVVVRQVVLLLRQ